MLEQNTTKEILAMESKKIASELRRVQELQDTPLLNRVRFYRRLEHALEQTPHPNGHSSLGCREGCSYCCHYHVYVTAIEAFAIVEHVRATFTATDRLATIERLRRNVMTVKHMTVDEHIHTNVACAFLSISGSCSIYNSRPLACRRHHSYEPETCKATFDDPSQMGSHMQSRDRILLSTVQEWAHAIANKAENLDPSLYEMNAALLEAFENTAAWKRWRGGKVAFPNVRDRLASGGLPSL